MASLRGLFRVILMTLSEVVLATTPGSLIGKVGLALNSLGSGLLLQQLDLLRLRLQLTVFSSYLIIELLAMLILIGCTLGLSDLGFAFFTSIADFLPGCFSSDGAPTWCPTRADEATEGEIFGDSTFSRTPFAREGDLSGLGDILIRLGECLAWFGGELFGDTLWFWLLISAL